jgi:hypothetical protein
MTFRPWIGSEYGTGGFRGKRVLILGESHYEWAGWSQAVDRIEDVTNFCVREQLDGRETKAFWTNIVIAFLNQHPTLDNKRSFWQPTGRKQAARVPGKNPATGEPQGELLRHPKGSNGDVHRGRDLKPRHVIKAIFLKTITDPGLLALPPDSDGHGRRRSGAARRKRAQAPHAFITNSSDAMQGIALDAAEGDPVARGQLLRLLHDMHEALQPAPDEAKSGGGPILPKFNRPTQPAAPPTTTEPSEDLPAVTDADGNPYVDPEA